MHRIWVMTETVAQNLLLGARIVYPRAELGPLFMGIRMAFDFVSFILV
jgi:hypothetical protein